MNVGELLRERDRLLGVIEEAKSARSKLKQVNILIAMYGDAANVELVGTNGNSPGLVCPECGAGPYASKSGYRSHMTLSHGTTPTAAEPVSCEQCDAGPFSGSRGLNMHVARVHTGKIKSPGQKPAKAKAKERMF